MGVKRGKRGGRKGVIFKISCNLFDGGLGLWVGEEVEIVITEEGGRIGFG